MKAFIFDTETTGLIANSAIRLEKQPRIIDLYCAKVDLKAKKILDEVDVLINPGIKIPEDPKRITGITDEMVEHEPPFGNWLVEKIEGMMKGCDAVIAHNLSYDFAMLNFEYQRLQCDPPPWPRRRICTVEQTVHLTGYRLKMEQLHEMIMGSKFADAHRAKPDTIALINVCYKLFEKGII